MSVTARDVIQGALKLIGVIDPIETVAPEDAADGLIMLNDLVDLWALEDLNMYSTQNVSATFSGISATVGPSGTFVTARPISINHAFYRKSGIDYQLQLATEEQYDAITMKSTVGDYPSVLFYSPDSPLATIYVWPVPTALTLYLNINTQLDRFTDLDTVYELPQGYRLSLKYALAKHMAPFFQRPVPDIVMTNMASVLRILKRSNVVIPTVRLDSHAGNDGRRLNILSNQLGPIR